MSYTINTYNGNQLAVVADGTIDTTVDIKLIGKNYAGYGEAQNENFVFLLENFSNPISPPKPMTGQIWFDNGTKKLKFYDSIKWRTTGGAEIGASAPAGLTIGDFWWDTTNKQLKAYDGAGYILIGPQAAGTATTEMLSSNVQDTPNHASHAIIQGIINGETIFVISSDAEFTLDTLVNPIPGFNKIEQGITLPNTPGIGDASQGVTTSDFRLWGTATNSERLGGILASGYIQSNSASFGSIVHFADVGYTVGTEPTERLHVFIDNVTPTIYNTVTQQIVFKTTTPSGNITNTPLILNGADIMPGTSLTSNIGSALVQFNNVYANSFVGTATQANTLNVSGSYQTASSTSSAGTIVSRTVINDTTTVPGVTLTPGTIKATYFAGIATTAYYADLAEKYLADAVYAVGTVVMVGGDQEVTACQIGNRALGTVSENPAFMMNTGLEGGTYIALKGRVPVKASGPVRKGAKLIAGENGTAVQSDVSTDYFAISLVDSDDTGVRLIESIVL